jgi:hypothetical protein
MFDVRCVVSSEDYDVFRDNIYHVYQVFSSDIYSATFLIYTDSGWSLVPCGLFTVE